MFSSFDLPGVADRRTTAVRADLSDLSSITPAQLCGSTGHGLGGGTLPVLRLARQAFGLLEPAPVEVLAARWLTLTGAKGVHYDDVLDFAVEQNAVGYAAAGAALRAGHTIAEASALSGLAEGGAAKRLAAWLGSAERCSEDLIDDAVECRLAGFTSREWAARHDLTPSTARTWWARAGAVVAELTAIGF